MLPLFIHYEVLPPFGEILGSLLAKKGLVRCGANGEFINGVVMSFPNKLIQCRHHSLARLVAKNQGCTAVVLETKSTDL